MSTEDTQFAWWSRLRHSGLLLSPVVQIEKYAAAPKEPKWYQPEKLRTAYNRFLASIDRSKDRPQLAQGDILTWVDALLEKYIGHEDQRLSRSHSIPESLTAVIRIGSRTETLRPDRVLFDADGKTPLLLVKADTSPHIGRGKGRTEYARFLELLRGSGHRLGLLTNGLQFRLVYAGLDFESWCEWESERWFEDAEGAEELLGLRQMLFPTQITDNKGEVTGAGLPGLLAAIEESRKRQADLSQVLRENIRQAVELLLEDVSHASRTDPDLFHHLISPASSDKHLTDAEAQEALLQATVRVVMRMVVCLFAESRGLLPVNDLIYSQAYGVRTLYELLDETVRHEGSQMGLMSRQSAWARLMALFRLIHGGSAHGNFALRPYGGALFRPGEADDDDAVSRALFILEHKVSVNDATIFRVLRKLLRGPLPVLRGRSKTYVEGPVDYTELRTEFIGLIYEGLLDYRVKRTTEEIGPQVFLKLGRQPVLPLSRLEAMLEDDPGSLKDLFTKLKKESVAATVESDEESEGDSDEDTPESEEGEESSEELSVEAEEEEEVADQPYLDAVQAARRWARQAIIATKLIGQQRARETDTEYDGRIEAAIDELIERVVAPGEFYLVRAGNTRKGTGTFYTRPQLAVPTVHRTLEPLCFKKDDKGVLTPKTPDEILALKVCDPACGSASFLVAALHYLTDALYRSLCFHCGLDDPKRATKITLPFGKPATGKDTDATVPLPPDDPNRGEEFAERVQALLRRHVVERCIYGVDINPLAIEFARVSLWVETLDPELPFSFLDHKIKVGNSLVGCWLNRVEHYPLKAWEREGGDGKGGPQTELIEEFLKGEKIGNRRSGDGRIKQEMRQVINDKFDNAPRLFANSEVTTESVVADARQEYERVHEISVSDPDQRERHYRQNVENSPAFQTLKSAMDEWCAIWFWSADEELLEHVPTPLTFHRPSAEKDSLVAQIAEEVRFFHWELQFPDVFTPNRSGFDAMIGNPPWDVFEPSSQEFFGDVDPLFRTYTKQTALRQQAALLDADPSLLTHWTGYNASFKCSSNWSKNVSSPFDVPLGKGKAGKTLANTWERRRGETGVFSRNLYPFRLLGSGKPNAYKLFSELFWTLLQHGGRVGIILPTGIYSDLGTTELRQEFFSNGTMDFLYAFQNEKKLFPAVFHGFKFVALFLWKGGSTQTFKARFRFGVGDSPSAQEVPDDLLTGDNKAMLFTTAEVKTNSPKTLSLVEIRGQRDLRIFRQIYSTSGRIGDKDEWWDISFAQEINMTSESRHFPPLEKWESLGFSKDNFGRWNGLDGRTAIPFLQGISIHQFDISQKAWTSGLGRSAVWVPVPHDNKHFGPKFLIDEEWLRSSPKVFLGPKIGYRRVARSTDTRTFIGCTLSGFGCSDKLATLRVNSGDWHTTLLVSAFTNSLSFDYITRFRVGGGLDWNLLEQLPLPRIPSGSLGSIALRRTALSVAGLTFLHRRFAPEWMSLLNIYDELSKQQWKHWWCVTEADRLRRRIEIESISAESYGIDADDFDWITKEDTRDPKGFYRVERHLPFEERLTGLSARAFRALKEGKWSAETVGQLSNDEFFDLLGIPELTNAKAAQAKGLAGPLILKRDGCHSWHPENFPKDDPRHGWTWEDCKSDAIALLGSEEALEEYIAQATAAGENADDEDEEPDLHRSGPKDLFGNRTPTDLFGNELRPKKRRRR